MHFKLVVAGASFFVANSVKFVKWTQMACTWSWVCDSGLMGVLIPGASNVGPPYEWSAKEKLGPTYWGRSPARSESRIEYMFGGVNGGMSWGVRDDWPS